MVKILGLAADIDHAVDRARPAQYPPARIGDGAAVGAGIRLSRKAPGDGRVVEQLHVAGRDVDQRVAVAPAGLDQHHPGRRIFAQPIGQHAPGRAGADDHVIRLHSFLPSPRLQDRREVPARKPGRPRVYPGFFKPPDKQRSLRRIRRFVEQHIILKARRALTKTKSPTRNRGESQTLGPRAHDSPPRSSASVEAGSKQHPPLKKPATGRKADFPGARIRSRRDARRPDRRAAPRVVARGEDAGEQHRQNPGQKDAVEGAGTADRGDRRAQPLHLADIEQVGSDQATEGARDISERRSLAPRQDQRHRGRRQGRHKYRQRDAETGNRGRQQMAHRRDDGDSDEPAHPQPMSDQQVKRQQSGNERAADVDRDHRARPIGDRRNDVIHAEKRNDLPGNNLTFGQLHHRDVQIAAGERGKQPNQRHGRPKPHSPRGKAKRPHLDPHHHDKIKHRQQRKMRQAERQVLELAQIHLLRLDRRESFARPPPTTLDGEMRFAAASIGKRRQSRRDPDQANARCAQALALGRSDQRRCAPDFHSRPTSDPV